MLNIFQTWKTLDSMPRRLMQCRQTWLDLHPTANNSLIDHRFIWDWLGRNTYRFPNAVHDGHEFIRTIDMFRYCYLLDHGGLYVDLDFYCLKAVEPLLREAGDGVLVGSMKTTDDKAMHSIPNAWMYSAKPGHPLWLLVLDMAQSRRSDPRVEWATGPVLLRDAIDQYLGLTSGAAMSAVGNVAELARRNKVLIPAVLPPVTILPPDRLYPLSWADSRSQPTVARFRAAASLDAGLINAIPVSEHTYAFTYWEYSWRDDPLDF